MKKIPIEIKGIYDEICNEVTWTHARWKIYIQLYSDSRIGLLDESASTFFYIVQDMLISSTITSICKLLDPMRSCGHDNLSLRRLQAAVVEHADHGLAGRMNQILVKIDTIVEPFKANRDKHIAHLDLNSLMRPEAHPIPSISEEMIRDMLGHISAYMNEIEGCYNDSEIGYSSFIMNGSDGDALVSLLAAGLRYGELVGEGALGYDDWRQGKWNDALT